MKDYPPTGVLADGPAGASAPVAFRFIPEKYECERKYPMVVALHGGGRKADSIFARWLPLARRQNVILVAPNSVGRTWSFDVVGDDIERVLKAINGLSETYNVDLDRVLLTGMSDGGTQSYIWGVLEDSVFSHLAPFAAAFDPVMMMLASAERLSGLPIYIVHGMNDMLFPVEHAYLAEEYMRRHGAKVTLRALEDEGHTFVVSELKPLLNWFLSNGG